MSFNGSTVTRGDIDALAHAEGVEAALPLGIAQTRLEGDKAASAAIFGLPEETRIPGDAARVPAASGIVASEAILDEAGVEVGDTLTASGVELEIAGAVADDYYSHTPVAWVSTETWQQLAHVPEAGGEQPVGTVAAVAGTRDDAGWEALGQDSGTVIETVGDSFAGLEAYQSERGSLATMQGFLYAISALVTVSFLSVWTIQRSRDLAILRALGASPRYLIGDAVGQAALVLAVGAGLGALVGWGLGAWASTAVPFALTTSTVAVPALGVWALGLLGSLGATRSIARVDPLAALGGNA